MAVRALRTFSSEVFEVFTAPLVHCSAKLDSLGCQPALGASGSAGLSEPSPFDVTATGVLSQRAGMLFYGLGQPVAVPFLGGTLCAPPPLRRTPLAWSAGSSTADCSGSFAFDFNAWAQAGSDPQLTAGTMVQAQYWYRDPASPDATGIGLTGAVSFGLCP